MPAGREATWSRPAQAVTMFLRGGTVRAATPITLVVGTLLSAINQGDVIVGGHPHADTWLRVAANYVVPFLVSSYGYLSARKAPAHHHIDPANAPHPLPSDEIEKKPDR